MTDKQISEVIKDMRIVVDTREVKNEHITNWLTENNIPFIREKLDSGDYSFDLPNYPELGLDRIYLVEKKNSLTEIAGNFTSGRERFVREFERIPENAVLHLLIEGATWKKVLNGSYRGQFPPKSMLASLLTWSIRYDTPVWFVGIDESPELIYNILKYELMEHLKSLREV